MKMKMYSRSNLSRCFRDEWWGLTGGRGGAQRRVAVPWVSLPVKVELVLWGLVSMRFSPTGSQRRGELTGWVSEHVGPKEVARDGKVETWVFGGGTSSS
jgi:hypothetical protein